MDSFCIFLPPDFPPRYYRALYSYDPSSPSPNTEGAEEELAFEDGDIILVSHITPLQQLINLLVLVDYMTFALLSEYGHVIQYVMWCDHVTFVPLSCDCPSPCPQAKNAVDEDGFFEGELSGHHGLVPINMVEEVSQEELSQIQSLLATQAKRKATHGNPQVGHMCEYIEEKHLLKPIYMLFECFRCW